LGEEADDILESTNITDEDRKKYSEVLAKAILKSARMSFLSGHVLIDWSKKKMKQLNILSLVCTSFLKIVSMV